MTACVHWSAINDVRCAYFTMAFNVLVHPWGRLYNHVTFVCVSLVRAPSHRITHHLGWCFSWIYEHNRIISIATIWLVWICTSANGFVELKPESFNVLFLFGLVFIARIKLFIDTMKEQTTTYLNQFECGFSNFCRLFFFSVCIRILFIYLSKTLYWSLNDIFSQVRHKYVCNLLETNWNELIVHLDVCEQQNKWVFFLFFSLKPFSKFSMRSRLSLISMQIINSILDTMWFLLFSSTFLNQAVWLLYS